MTPNRQMLRTVMLAAMVLSLAVIFVTPALAGKFPATGQITTYPADKNGDAVGPVDVPDDGALTRGATLNYKLLPDGTIKDKNTGLIWEMKVAGSGCLHCVDDTYRWSGDGSQETIWDWLDAINTEGVKGYAGYDDWRIPNRRELESIVNLGLFNPAIDPIFGPTFTSNYWSSTTNAFSTFDAWFVSFFIGNVGIDDKTLDVFVRAVRGGSK